MILTLKTNRYESCRQQTQTEVSNHRRECQQEGRPFYCCPKNSSLTGRLFNRDCTFNYKRLPLLGLFVNSLLLGTLLISVVLDGIKTLVERPPESSESAQRAALDSSKLTQIIVLVASAMIGFILRNHSSDLSNKAREQLSPEDLLRYNEPNSNKPRLIVKYTRNSVIIVGKWENTNYSQDDSHHSFDLTQNIHEASSDQQILASFNGLKRNVRLTGSSICLILSVALIIEALVVIFIGQEAMIKVVDGGLSILVALLSIFGCLYGPFVATAKVLLQIVPPGLNLSVLSTKLESSEGCRAVRDLKVWTLTERGEGIATCRLVLDEALVQAAGGIKDLIENAKRTFAEHNIHLTTIELTFSTSQVVVLKL